EQRSLPSLRPRARQTRLRALCLAVIPLPPGNSLNPGERGCEPPVEKPTEDLRPPLAFWRPGGTRLMAVPVPAPLRALAVLCLASAGWAFTFGIGTQAATLRLADAGLDKDTIGLNAGTYYLGM